MRIYDDGESTGLDFFVQLKSTEGRAPLKRQEKLSYPLEVKDLKHWERLTRTANGSSPLTARLSPRPWQLANPCTCAWRV